MRLQEEPQAQPHTYRTSDTLGEWWGGRRRRHMVTAARSLMTLRQERGSQLGRMARTSLLMMVTTGDRLIRAPVMHPMRIRTGMLFHCRLWWDQKAGLACCG